jgi:uncharacterized protein (DUF2147 family)
MQTSPASDYSSREKHTATRFVRRETMAMVLRSFLTAGVCASGAHAGSIAAGVWATPSSHGRVQIADCETGLCGRVLDSAEISADPNALDRKNANPALRLRKLKGAALFDRMTGGPPVWSGTVYNPVDGKTYAGALTVISPDRLELKGCVVAPFCKTEIWTRIK